ncbi:MAG: hypothetical protein ACXVDZ_17065 [Bacteroidia bacterium]
METDRLKINTLLFFFNAMKELNKAVDSALDSLNDNGLSDQEKFHLVLSMLGDYGLNQDLFINIATAPTKTENATTEIGGPIQKFDYQDFVEERFEILLLNGLIGISISMN